MGWIWGPLLPAQTQVLNPVVPKVTLSASGYIAANAGSDTTAKLTAPTGKTSGSHFQAGKISDDTNFLPDIDLDASYYTELEWCIILAAGLTAGDEFTFRVTCKGVECNTNTQYAVVTIGSSGVTISVYDTMTTSESLD